MTGACNDGDIGAVWRYAAVMLRHAAAASRSALDAAVG
jgi:hypothetical protein